MEYEDPTSDETQCLDLDIISTLPVNIIESILSIMPIRDALRTSVLSKKWRYCWRSVPKIEFTDTTVNLNSSNSGGKQLEKYKLVTAIFHVLLLHIGPEILEFNWSVAYLDMDSVLAQIISYLARGNKLKQLIFVNQDDDDSFYKLPVSFFSLQGLEVIYLLNCTFEPPLDLNRFSRLKRMTLGNVEVSAQMLQRFLSKCRLLEHISLIGAPESVDFVAEGDKFTIVDLLQCVPLIQSLVITDYYMMHLCAGDMPHKLLISLAHLKYLSLDVCMIKQISSVLCIIRSSPVLERCEFQIDDLEKLPVKQDSINFLDPEHHSEFNFDHLKIMDIRLISSNLARVMKFVKLIMAKSPVLKKLQIDLGGAYVDEDVKMLREMLLSFPRASPSSKLIVKRL
ncbi:F-box/FBD/LRR-repeat protein At1g13570-like [Bidens hawaiensis]|uniref:F-box/FBD/LRR-repeat protein At1g13570-like n=1 Tax=Bidens hawaiensis TaxID=980011 RepID=UPI004049886A